MDWFSISPEQIAGITVSSLVLYFAIMGFVRINGLRSFSKMSAHDFAATIAIGSILATTILSEEPSILQGCFSVFILLLIQSLYSRWRLKRSAQYLENSPLLLMEGPKILHTNLKKAKITEADLIARLREANVLDINSVKAVVFESTGDIAVLHGDKPLGDRILKDVKR